MAGGNSLDRMSRPPLPPFHAGMEEVSQSSGEAFRIDGVVLQGGIGDGIGMMSEDVANGPGASGVMPLVAAKHRIELQGCGDQKGQVLTNARLRKASDEGEVFLFSGP